MSAPDLPRFTVGSVTGYPSDCEVCKRRRRKRAQRVQGQVA